MFALHGVIITWHSIITCQFANHSWPIQKATYWVWQFISVQSHTFTASSRNGKKKMDGTGDEVWRSAEWCAGVSNLSQHSSPPHLLSISFLLFQWVEGTVELSRWTPTASLLPEETIANCLIDRGWHVAKWTVFGLLHLVSSSLWLAPPMPTDQVANRGTGTCFKNKTWQS